VIAADVSSNGSTTGIAAVAGLVGVLLGGWMAGSRDRWKWRADNRRDAYMALLRSISDVREAFDGLSEATGLQHRVAEIEGRAAAAQEAARRFDEARAAVRIVGSHRMARYVDGAGMFDFLLEARYASVSDLSSVWDAVDDEGRSGWADAAIDWATHVEHIAVTELNGDRRVLVCL